MKRIKFTRTERYESEGRNRGPVFQEGSTHDLDDAFADRWLRRGAAVEVNTRRPMPADEPRSDAPPLAADAEPEAASPAGDVAPAPARTLSLSQPLGTARKAAAEKK